MYASFQFPSAIYNLPPSSLITPSVLRSTIALEIFNVFGYISLILNESRVTEHKWISKQYTSNRLLLLVKSSVPSGLRQVFFRVERISSNSEIFFYSIYTFASLRFVENHSLSLLVLFKATKVISYISDSTLRLRAPC